MSQVDSVRDEKTCLSHMYHISVCDKDVEQLDTHKVSSFDSCYILSLNSTFD